MKKSPQAVFENIDINKTLFSVLIPIFLLSLSDFVKYKALDLESFINELNVSERVNQYSQASSTADFNLKNDEYVAADFNAVRNEINSLLLHSV